MRITKTKLTEWTLILYLLILMMSASTGAPAVRLVRILTAAVLGMYILSCKRGKISVSSYVILSTLFLLYNVVMCFFAFSQSYAIPYTATLAYVVVIDVMAYQYLRQSAKSMDVMLSAMIAGSTGKALLDFFRLGISYYLTHRSSPYGSANTIGYFSAIAVVFSWYLWKKYRGKKGLPYLAAGALNLLFVVLSSSRKALIYIAIPFVFYMLIKSRNPAVILRNVILSLLAAAAACWALMHIGFLYDSLGHRLEAMLIGLSGGDGDGSTATRLYLMDFGIRYFKERPVFGYGMSNFKALMAAFAPHRTTLYAHNNYIELLVDCGLLGTAVYYGVYLDIARRILARIKERNTLDIVFLGLLLSFLVAEYGLVTYNDPIHQFIVMLMFIHAAANGKKRGEHPSASEGEENP